MTVLSNATDVINGSSVVACDGSRVEIAGSGEAPELVVSGGESPAPTMLVESPSPEV